MFCNIPMDDFPGVDRKDNKYIQMFESDRNDIIEVGCPNFGSMIAQESPPVLRSSWIRILSQ